MSRRRHPPARTVADRIRRELARHGVDTRALDDRELGDRLLAMPVEVADDQQQAARWMRFGTVSEPVTGSIHA